MDEALINHIGAIVMVVILSKAKSFTFIRDKSTILYQQIKPLPNALLGSKLRPSRPLYTPLTRHTKECIYYSDAVEDAIGRFIRRANAGSVTDIVKYNMAWHRK